MALSAVHQNSRYPLIGAITHLYSLEYLCSWQLGPTGLTMTWSLFSGQYVCPRRFWNP